MVKQVTNHIKSLGIFPFSCLPILSLSLFLIISFTLLPIISSPHFPIISEAWAATYYVDAINGNDNNSGLSPSTPRKTIAKVNASRFQPGDQVLFKRGQTWREQLTVPSSGSSGNSINFGAYGSGNNPIIDGSDVASTWKLDIGVANVYNATVAATPNQVFRDGVLATLGASKAALNDHEWFASGTTLSYRDDSGTPQGSGYTITASQRNNALVVNGKNYITIQNLDFQYTNQDGISVIGGSDNLTINGIVSQYNYYDGIYIIEFSTSQDNGVIQNSTFKYNGHNGIRLSLEANNWLIKNNTVNNNGTVTSDDPPFTYTSGIGLWGNITGLTNVIVENNRVFSNGLAEQNGSRGQGIWVD